MFRDPDIIAAILQVKVLHDVVHKHELILARKLYEDYMK
jgi:hypothetical protein